MTATDELRRLLDERGVEWMDGGMFHRTHWVIDGIHHVAFEQGGKLYLQSSIGPLTPEQAITATLGEANGDECYLMRHGEKFPVELDYGFIGIMPLVISVAGFRYVLEVPYEK